VAFVVFGIRVFVCCDRLDTRRRACGVMRMLTAFYDQFS
jgi:hypothetical protein